MKCFLELNDAEIDSLESVFSGVGPMTSAQNLLDKHINDSMEQLGVVLQIRYVCSVSGAMRWPWSQEAAISVNSSIRLK